MASDFDGLTAIVQYRGKPERGFDTWHNMAAFDQRSVADQYAEGCSKGDPPWEYRVIDAHTSADREENS